MVLCNKPSVSLVCKSLWNFQTVFYPSNSQPITAAPTINVGPHVSHYRSSFTVTLYCFLQHAPGVPRILVGNRLHLAFKRQVPTEQARAYAEKNSMTFFEVSPLCNFNVIESFTELSRIVLMRHGMEKFWRPNRGELVTIFLFIYFFLTRLGRKHVLFCFSLCNSYTNPSRKWIMQMLCCKISSSVTQM